MATTYSITPVSKTVSDPQSLVLSVPVSFTVSRTGDLSQAADITWSIIDDASVTPGVERNFFVIPNGTATINGEPTGTVHFNAGASNAQSQITVTLKGGIDILPMNNDWGTFDLGVRLGIATQSMSGFSASASGGYGITSKNYVITGDGGTLSFKYQMYSIPDQADIFVNNTKVLSTGKPVSDTGELTYPGAAIQTPLHVGDNVQVVITGNIQGTVWDYTLDYAPGIYSVVEAHAVINTGPPGIAELARLSSDAYNGSPSSNIHGYKPFMVSGAPQSGLSGANIDVGFSGFSASAYRNADDTQVVIAFRGTSNAKEILGDTTWFTSSPSAQFEREVKDAVAFVSAVRAAEPSANITLTGHSLGGALAEIIGSYPGVGFDAPGAGAFRSTLVSRGILSSGSALEANYRLYGDQVSLVGTPIGNQYTVSDPPNVGSSIFDVFNDHQIDNLVSQLSINAGVISAGVLGPNYLPALLNAVQGTLVGSSLQLLSFAVTAGANKFIDPSTNHEFVFIETGGSPYLQTVVLPTDLNVADYRFETLIGSNWIENGTIHAGTTVNLADGARGFQAVPLDSSGAPTSMSSSFLFQASFAATGNVSATLLTKSGAETNYNDYNGDQTSDILWVNPNTLQTDVWKIGDGKWAGSVNIGTHPGAGTWAAGGIGDFNGDGTHDVFWFDKSSGNTDIWTLNKANWMASVTVGVHPGSATVAGVDDFNADGTSDILWRNPNGDIDEWQIVNGHWARSVDLGIHPGSGWQIAATGDFNHDGAADVLWSSSAGETDLWLLRNGNWMASVNPGSHPGGSNEILVGSGDFNGDGTRDILWQDKSTGKLDLWMINNGNWAGSVDLGTHPGANWKVAAKGDYNVDGTSDIFWENSATGETDVWLIKNGHWQASVAPGTHDASYVIVA